MAFLLAAQIAHRVTESLTKDSWESVFIIENNQFLALGLVVALR